MKDTTLTSMNNSMNHLMSNQTKDSMSNLLTNSLTNTTTNAQTNAQTHTQTHAITMSLPKSPMPHNNQNNKYIIEINTLKNNELLLNETLNKLNNKINNIKNIEITLCNNYYNEIKLLKHWQHCNDLIKLGNINDIKIENNKLLYELKHNK